MSSGPSAASRPGRGLVVGSLYLLVRLLKWLLGLLGRMLAAASPRLANMLRSLSGSKRAALDAELTNQRIAEYIVAVEAELRALGSQRQTLAAELQASSMEREALTAELERRDAIEHPRPAQFSPGTLG